MTKDHNPHYPIVMAPWQRWFRLCQPLAILECTGWQMLTHRLEWTLDLIPRACQMGWGARPWQLPNMLLVAGKLKNNIRREDHKKLIKFMYGSWREHYNATFEMTWYLESPECITSGHHHSIETLVTHWNRSCLGSWCMAALFTQEE